MVSNTQVEDCAWLERNIDEYSYLCQLIEVASECPKTCGFCEKVLASTILTGVPGPELYVSTGLKGTFRWDGIVFDYQGTQDLTITGIDIHTWIATNYTVQIFTKNGTASDTETPWKKVADTAVTGAGYGRITRVPSAAFSPIDIRANERHAFYVTLDTPELVMESKVRSGARDDALLLNSDPNLRFSSGSAVTYTSQKQYPGYNPNIQIRYRLTSTTDAERPECEDKEGNILIDEFVGERTCDWLASHLYLYHHVCTYVSQAVQCPKTCNVCYIVNP